MAGAGGLADGLFLVSVVFVFGRGALLEPLPELGRLVVTLPSRRFSAPAMISRCLDSRM